MIIFDTVKNIVKAVTGTNSTEEAVDRIVEERTEGESITQDSLKENSRSQAFLNNIVGVMKYPQTIDTNEQPHSVTFTIKVREQGKLGQAAIAAGFKFPEDEQPSQENRTPAENLKGVVQAGAAFGGAALGALLTKNGNVIGKTIGTGAGAAAGYTVSDALVKNIMQPNRTIVTQDVITLYVPQSPQANYEASYQDTDLGLAGAIGQTGGELTDILSGDLGEFATRQLVSAADIGKAIGVNVNIRGAVQAATRKITNPFKEQLFKTMNFREFGFEFKFAPRNDGELQSAKNIIDAFKYHMHPEKTTDGLFLIYPSEFDIEFRYKGKQNTFVNRISSCALVNMKVEYGSGGVLTTIRNTAGAPSEITMGLQFKELEILTKERIQEGY